MPKEVVKTFLHQPAELCYDRHGYEFVRPVGPEVLCARFTPDIHGTYYYTAETNNGTIKSGKFVCTKSGYSGYVKISNKDKRYFEIDNGESFCPIGLNLASLKYDNAPKSTVHFEKVKLKCHWA